MSQIQTPSSIGRSIESATPGAAAHPFLRIDAMRLADLPIVGQLELRCFTAPWSETAYRHELTSNPRSFYFVIRTPERGDETAGSPDSALPPVLGYGGYWLLGEEAHIVTIASHPDYRRRALGELMLLYLIGHARDAQVNEVTLEVRVSNRPARALYEKWGFVEVGLRKRYYQDNGEDALLMTLHHVEREEIWQPLAQRLHLLLSTLDALVLAAAPPADR